MKKKNKIYIKIIKQNSKVKNIIRMIEMNEK